MFLSASDGSGHIGYSNVFTVTGLPTALAVAVPANATEGQGTVSGTVSIPAALGFPLTVRLTSGDGSRASVPSSVIIAAGQTSAHADHDRRQRPAGRARARADQRHGDGIHGRPAAPSPYTTTKRPPYRQHDRQRPRDRRITSATITSSLAPDRDITVQLVSSDPTGLTCRRRPSCTPARRRPTSALAMHDDHVIEGSRADHCDGEHGQLDERFGDSHRSRRRCHAGGGSCRPPAGRGKSSAAGCSSGNADVGPGGSLDL